MNGIALYGPKHRNVKDSRDLTPDPNFRLTAEQRRLVRSRYDADALEALLAHLPAEHRGPFLAAASDIPLRELALHFPSVKRQMEAPVPPGRLRGIILPQLDDFEVDHPHLQGLLDAACRRSHGI